MENNRGFQVAVCADTTYGAYELMIQGNATQDATCRAASEGKQALTFFDIGVRENAWTLLGRAEGDADKYGDRPETSFISITAFGVVANQAEKVKKGQLLAICGKISRREFTRRDKTTGEKVEIVASNVVILDESSPKNTNIVGVKSLYEDRNHTQQEAPMACCADAKVTKVGTLQNSQDGTAYLNVTLETAGCIDRAWDLADGTWSKDKEYKEHRLYATLWGKSAENLNGRLAVDNRVCVTGTMSQRVASDGKSIMYGMRIRQLTRFLKPRGIQTDDESAEAADTQPEAPAAPDPEQKKRTRKPAAKKEAASAPESAPEDQPVGEPEDEPVGAPQDAPNGDDEEIKLPF